MELEVLLLANSYKRGGRCLAGLRTDTWEWVRPVTQRPTRAVAARACSSERGVLRPLDLIRVRAVQPAPLPHQSENIVIDEHSIQWLDTKSPRDCLPYLTPIARKNPYFLRAESPAISAKFFTTGPATRPSLALIAVPSAAISPRQAGEQRSRVSRRIQFVRGGATWSLPLTDEFFSPERHTFQVGASFLCLSVGDFFAPKDSHYKIAAGVIPKS